MILDPNQFNGLIVSYNKNISSIIMDYSTILQHFFILGALGFVSGRLVLKISSNIKWVYFNYYIYATLLVVSLLLEYSEYLWFVIFSIVFMILAAMFLIYKVKLVTNFNISSTTPMFTALKINPINQNLFFWMMFLASFITIIGIVISSMIYKNMTLKQGLHGLPGERGKKGDMGDEYTFDNGYKDICYYKLLEYSNAVMEKYKDDSNPVIEYPPNTDHLNNLLFKEQLKRICYSKELENALLEKINALGTTTAQGTTTTKNEELDKFLIDNLKDPVETWVSKILDYKNGLFFLEDHFANVEDIQLYLKIEKTTIENIEKKLITISDSWNWGKCQK